MPRDFTWLVCPICNGLMIPGPDGEPNCDRCKQRIAYPVILPPENDH